MEKEGVPRRENDDKPRRVGERMPNIVGNRPLPEGIGLEMGDIKGMIPCPYYESHVVGAGRYAKHVNACRRAAPEHIRTRFIVCDNNNTHHVPRELYAEHLRICPDLAASSTGVSQLTNKFYDNNKTNNNSTPEQK